MDADRKNFRERREKTGILIGGCEMNFHTFHTAYLFSAQAWSGAIGTQLHFGHDVLPRDGKGEGGRGRNFLA